ncbi:putative transmembrane region and signal peptide protein [Rhodopirellula islandica]|uniref:Transmembrane region and signal peptide protein n=1 Tax=Rhodopirellula islandica TaxID=595434 RepID=A0A0J1B5G5_RHOIS|nr:heavy-metal-associated domain-containing protein [Rhodopirellula islandica]KLU01967.1 putative transmembrane region and signal peptide protein [Rhodopirellula islandica]
MEELRMMFGSNGNGLGLVALACLLSGWFSPAAASAETLDSKRDPSHQIVMTVGEMCGGCVKKITARFDSVDAVTKVVCSIEKKSVALVAKDGVKLSPKGIWELMESIGKTPKKMITPDGTFTSKPKR